MSISLIISKRNCTSFLWTSHILCHSSVCSHFMYIKENRLLSVMWCNFCVCLSCLFFNYVFGHAGKRDFLCNWIHRSFKTSWFYVILRKPLLPLGFTVFCFSSPALGFFVGFFFFLIKKQLMSGPGWCGSVDWVLARDPKGLQFNSQSGHMPGLQARSPVGGVWEATNQCLSHVDVSLPLFAFPSSL